jgi:hypothetical protein
MSEMIDEISRESAKKSPTVDSIGDILRNHLSRIKQRQGISFQVMAEIISFGDKFLNTAVYDNINKYISELEKILAEGVRCGSIRDDIDLESSAMLMFGIIHGLVNIWALGSYGFDISKKFESLWEIFCKTLKHEQRNN